MLVVDLGQPVSDARECLERLLPALQAARKPGQGSRRRMDKWPLYLRVLDAEAAGATSCEVADCLSDDDAPTRTVRFVRDALASARLVLKSACRPTMTE